MPPPPSAHDCRHDKAHPRSFNLAGAILKGPIHLYRWTMKPYVGWSCRHVPSCSEYALAAIDHNGAWRGLWLTLSRLSRCHAWGTRGYDPVPDLRAESHVLAPWRYGRWRWRDGE